MAFISATGGRGLFNHGVSRVGGLYAAEPSIEIDEVRSLIDRSDIRAIRVDTPNLSWLAGSSIEYLTVTVPVADITPINSMSHLHGLSLDAWNGELDFTRLLHLESFAATDVGPRQIDTLLVTGSDTLRELSVGQFREADLSGLRGCTQLVDLSINHSRSLASLAGLESLKSLKRASFTSCSKLVDIGAIATLASLEGLGFESCQHVTELDMAQSLSSLRALRFEGKKKLVLDVLSGHPSLASLWLVDGARTWNDFEPLFSSAQLNFVKARRTAFMRLDAGIVQGDIYEFDSEQLGEYEQLVARFQDDLYGPAVS